MKTYRELLRECNCPESVLEKMDDDDCEAEYIELCQLAASDGA